MTGFCSSPPRAASIAPRRMTCPRLPAPRAASTSPICWPSSRKSASRRSSRSRATRTRHTWCSPPRTAWSRSPNSPSSTPTAAVAWWPSTCVTAMSWWVRCCARPRMICCWSRLMGSPSDSVPPTRRCGRWAAPPPGCRACASTARTICCRLTSSVRAPTCWWPLRAVTPSAPRSRSTRYRDVAVRVC
ncbi:Uncharacterised protein [Mycobacteroides abscessus subsp. abscessus]|nr:Uncharacterised protein [Mycobacteroides abscessus subsp. abscessus]